MEKPSITDSNETECKTLKEINDATQEMIRVNKLSAKISWIMIGVSLIIAAIGLYLIGMSR